MKVYSVRDSKLDCYDRPFCAPTKGAAIRGFSDSVNDPQSYFYKHPEDFVLFELGDFDDKTGMFDVHVPESIGVAIEFKKTE